ncbi:MAG: PKD-like domain-containing protein, partial [Bacteroidia bacterium]
MLGYTWTSFTPPAAGLVLPGNPDPFSPNQSTSDTTRLTVDSTFSFGMNRAYLTVYDANGCKAMDSVQYNVVHGPVVSNQTDSTCSGIALNINLDTLLPGSGDTYSYTVASSDPTNVPAGPSRTLPSVSPITDSYSNTTGSDVFITYTVTPVEAGGCIGQDFTIMVKVQSAPLGAGFTAPLICSGTAASASLASSITNGMNGVGYSWQAADHPSVTGESTSAVSGATINDVLTNTGSVTANVVYAVTPPAGNGCTGAAFNVTVPVAAPPMAADTTIDICGTGAVNFDLAAYFAAEGNIGPYSFSWSGATVTGITGITTTASSASVIGDILNNSAGSAKLITYTVIATNTATSCVSTPFAVKVNLTTLAPALAEQGCTGCGEIQLSATVNGTSPNLTDSVQANANYVAGASLNWYADNSGSLGATLPTAPTVSTATPGAQAWWVEQSTAPGCVSPPIRIVVDIPMPTAPGLTITSCPGQLLNLASYVVDYTLQATMFEFYNGQPSAGGTLIGRARAFRGRAAAGSSVIVSPTQTTLYYVRTHYVNGTYADGTLQVSMGTNCGGALPVAVALEGAQNGSAMRTSLQAGGYLPQQEPYTLLGYQFTGGGGGESMTASALTNPDVVDWVIVELRDSVNPTQVVYSRAALLLKDGSILDSDGQSQVLAPVPNDVSYYLAVLHRNHLGVMTAQPVRLGTMVD